MRKQAIYILSVFVAVASFSSCDLVELNENVKDPSEVAAEQLFTNAQVQMGTFLHQVDVNIGIFQFMAQHWTMTTYTDETRYNIEGRTIAGSDWQIMYNALNDLQQASKQVGKQQPATAEEEKIQANKQASIEIMQTLIYSKLVDIFGNVPYEEALNPDDPTPAYQDAMTIYKSIIDSLNTAISNIDPSAGGFSTSADVYYGGNMGKWKKFANSLKLRLGMMFADVDKQYARTVVEAAVAGGVFDSNVDNAMIPFMTTQPNGNPVWENVIASGRDDYVPAKALISKMNALNDPRRAIFFTNYPSSSNNYKGGIYGELNEYGSFSHFAPTIVLPGRDGLIMGYAEVEFLLAEAVARGFSVSHSAAHSSNVTHYEAAITADMEFWNARATAAGVDEEITDQQIKNYLDQPSVQWEPNSTNWRETLGVQKWIGLFDQYLQAYTSYRRLDAPTLQPPDEAVNALKIVPVRFHYPVSEDRYNPKNVEAAAKAIGGDKFTTRLFWDVRGPGK